MTTEIIEANLVSRVNVGDMLTRTAARHPDRLAVVQDERRFTYRELDSWVNEVANGLSALSYRRGDRVALISGNTVEFLVTYYACAKLGLGCVPINLSWRAAEVAYVLKHSSARGLVVVGDLHQFAAEALALGSEVSDVFVTRGVARAPSFGNANVRSFDDLRGGAAPPMVATEDRDPLQYLYTSGTTAAPKGAVGSHLAVYLNSLGLAVDWSFRERDVIMCMLPLFHAAQLNLFCTPAVAVGAAMILMPRFDPDQLLTLIERENATVIFGLPSMYVTLLNRDDIAERDFASLRLAVYGMAPMPDALLRKAIEIFDCDFSLMFGQTEMGPVTTIFRPEHQLTHIGAVGTPSINTQVAIMDEDGNMLPPGSVGAIVYRSPQLMNGYLHDDAATRHALRHGWFHSGDIGRIDETGMLWFVDRDKDVIKTGAENVASVEVEKALFAMEPKIAEVAVVGLPHPRWGEAITAFVVPREGLAIDCAEVLVAVRERLVGFKMPKSIVVVDGLPKTSTGKVQKNQLRELYKKHYDAD